MNSTLLCLSKDQGVPSSRCQLSHLTGQPFCTNVSLLCPGTAQQIQSLQGLLQQMRNVLEGAGSDLRSLQEAEDTVTRLADSEASASSAGR